MNKNQKFIFTTAVIAATAVWSLAPRVARAEPSPALDRVSIWLGGYRADIDGFASVRDPSNNIDTGDQQFLSGKKTVERARLDWLIMDSQGFSVDYFRIHDDSARSIEQPFTFGGVNYTAAGRVASDTTLDIGNFSYRWWFGDQSNNNVFGLGLGAAYYKLDATLRASVGVGPIGYNTIQRYDESGWAPLVTLGWRAKVSEQVRLYADLSGVRKNGSDLSGTITNAAIGAEWFPWKNVGIGAEYASTRIRLKQKDDAATARVRLELDGPAVYLRLRF
ncbi:MAG TPA: hypothetical protein H9903_01865 [Candidatus Aquabacterium excrementipullorum]|nr:hypothetical protein [Candidatus Aquabacterium excrementipullorum]